eukprot:scaffold25041_cov66-Cyclotella_meneghiniana.AAC.2
MPPNITNPNDIQRDAIITTNSHGNNRNVDDDGVIIGPDLNPTKSPLDKKEYRHITLPNGLKCVLICDTVAMRQRKLEGYCEYEADSDDDDDDEEDDSRDDNDDDDDDDASDGKSENNGLRKAATALSVNVGSYHGEVSSTTYQ